MRGPALTELTADLAAKIEGATGFIFDMDGTIALGDAQSGGHRALPHATALLRSIKRRGIPVRIFTNGTAKPPSAYAASLRNAGFDLDDGEMMTPSSSAAAWFAARKIGRVRVLGIDGVMAPLREAGIEVIGPAQPATGIEAVYTGWYRDFGFPALEAACEDVWNGAIVTTASNVPFFATATGRGIGSSFAINAMIAAMTGRRAKVLGKPARIAFDVACDSMGIPRRDRQRVVVLGDDPALEMRMANAAGAIAIGMTTGLLKADRLGTMKPAEQPHVLLDSLEPLLALF